MGRNKKEEEYSQRKSSKKRNSMHEEPEDYNFEEKVMARQMKSKTSTELMDKIKKLKSQLAKPLPLSPKKNKAVRLIFMNNQEAIEKTLHNEFTLEDFNYDTKERRYRDITSGVDAYYFDTEASLKKIEMQEELIHDVDLLKHLKSSSRGKQN